MSPLDHISAMIQEQELLAQGRLFNEHEINLKQKQ